MSRLAQRFSFVSLGFLSSLTIAFIAFVYQVSPLRDPSFQPNSANAGPLIPWLRNVTESHWIHSATILTALLSANITIVLSGWAGRNTSQSPASFAVWFAVWLGFWGLLWITFTGYLLGQWLID